ncbi:MAG: pyridoxamine 5'-phosphate oxidase family protein [Anaerolineae bacterium]|nr:pyridoxamine 5'-phosphate oxidase family protein [Anaerolineae bacterium]
MAKFFDTLSEQHQDWIKEQKIFFVGSAPLDGDGHVNVSPKGYDCLRILDANTVAYLDLTGSGNETSAHIMENGRLTFMWCAVEGPANIMRVYGHGEVVLQGSERWQELAPLFELFPGARQIIVNHIDTVQTSCGYGVPFFDYKEERMTLQKYAINQGEEATKAYQQEKNQVSIDGLPTPLSTVSNE